MSYMGYGLTPPNYSIQCECGMLITGQSEKGVCSLVARHLKDGKYHMDWIEKNGNS